jgi:hypothetical protein
MNNKFVTYGFPIITLIFGIITFLFPFIMPVEFVAGQVREDSFLEYLNAFFLFLAGVCFIAIFFVSRTGNKLGKFKTPRNFLVLGLGLLVLFAAGEEISWGQRIIGFETPDAIEEHNWQGEFTLHNLGIFQDSESLFKADRLFHAFWFTLGVVIPMAAWLSQRARTWLTELGMPIFPILLGLQFLLFYILSKMYTPLGYNLDEFGGRLPEIREAQHALIFFLVGITLLLNAFNERKTKEKTGTV